MGVIRIAAKSRLVVSFNDLFIWMLFNFDTLNYLMAPLCIL